MAKTPKRSPRQTNQPRSPPPRSRLPGSPLSHPATSPPGQLTNRPSALPLTALTFRSRSSRSCPPRSSHRQHKSPRRRIPPVTAASCSPSTIAHPATIPLARRSIPCASIARPLAPRPPSPFLAPGSSGTFPSRRPRASSSAISRSCWIPTTPSRFANPCRRTMAIRFSGADTRARASPGSRPPLASSKSTSTPGPAKTMPAISSTSRSRRTPISSSRSSPAHLASTSPRHPSKHSWPNVSIPCRESGSPSVPTASKPASKQTTPAPSSSKMFRPDRP